ncbi:MAG: tetratricopeptide repeat protein [Nitrospirae bacterium]|nr:tetratricopeptide repeat protein [Nitrospirota bacterium]
MHKSEGRPSSLEVISALDAAQAHHRAGRLQQAEQLYRRVLHAAPDHPDALHGLGLMAYQLGRLEDAVGLLSRAIKEDPQNPTFHFNHGVVLQRQGRLDEAAASYARALSLNPQYAEACSNLGNVRLDQGRLIEAVASHEKAVAMRPGYVEAHNNLGVALKELGELDRAIGAYRQALRIKPDYVEAHCNLGMALMDEAKLEEAVACYARALQIKPDYVKAHYNLAFALIRQRQFDEALAALRKSAELKHDHGRSVQVNQLSRSRLKHDAEQIDYLLARGLLPPTHRSYLDALNRLRLQSERSGAARITVDPTALNEIAPSFNRILYYADTPALAQGALNPQLDVAAIEARYNGAKPEIMHIDDLLTAEALESLQSFCLASTIWKRDYENGYIGAFFGDGFSSPLLLQIAEELRTRFPGIFKHHLLTQAWAFKYDSEMTGLNIHADAAAVNVNFWITPDEANLDPERGGLIVWDKEAPKDWNFKEYNNTRNEPKVRKFLADSGARAVSIPYRQNRAVVFNSDLFHETDRLSFRSEYASRRVNITLLYGRRGA